MRSWCCRGWPRRARCRCGLALALAPQGLREAYVATAADSHPQHRRMQAPALAAARGSPAPLVWQAQKEMLLRPAIPATYRCSRVCMTRACISGLAPCLADQGRDPPAPAAS
jgi:hypothetical protein